MKTSTPSIFLTAIRAVTIVILLAASGHPGRVDAQEPSPPAPVADQENQSPPPQELDPKAREIRDAWDAATRTAIRGPATVPLLNQATLAVPEQLVFVPKEEAGRILRSYGNITSKYLLGIVTNRGPGDEVLIVIHFEKDGYVADEDAHDWNADDLLAELRRNNERANEDRVARGFPRHKLIGWIKKPTYDGTRHHLVWSVASANENEPEGKENVVNYNTFALGREGYLSLNLVTHTSLVDAQKPIAHALLDGLAYVPGKRYEDFNRATDKIAAYGLAALVGGIAAKKLGLFALAFALVAKFAKLGVALVAAFGVGLVKTFRGRK